MVLNVREAPAKSAYLQDRPVAYDANLFNRKYVRVVDTVTSGSSFVSTEYGLVARYSRALKFFYEKMYSFAEPNMIDVGAGSGAFTLLAALHPGASVVAFEPLKSAWNLINENVILNHLQIRTHVFRTALWTSRGVKVLAVPDHEIATYRASLGSIENLSPGFGVSKVRIATRSMDEMVHFTHPVDLIKIHTNGAELQVIIGGEGTIKRCKPDMFIRFNQRDCSQLMYNRDEIQTLLEGWGAIAEEVEGWLWVTWPEE
jgi:FkbM family methyltransferase